MSISESIYSLSYFSIIGSFAFIGSSLTDCFESTVLL